MSLCCELETESLLCSVTFQAMCCQRHWECIFTARFLSVMNTCKVCIFHRLRHFYPHCAVATAVREQRGGGKEGGSRPRERKQHVRSHRIGVAERDLERKSPEGQARVLIISFPNLTHPSCCLSNYLFLPFRFCFHLNFESAWTLLVCF